MHFLIKVLVIISLLGLSNCISKKKEATPISRPNPTNNMELDIIPDQINNISEKSKQSLSNIISVVDFKLGDPIILDSPKRFIQITILFTVEQYINYYKADQIDHKDDNEIGVYLNKKREEFYKKLGISEEKYIQYSVNNGELIQEFLAIHPKFAQAYESSLDLVTD